MYWLSLIVVLVKQLVYYKDEQIEGVSYQLLSRLLLKELQKKNIEIKRNTEALRALAERVEMVANANGGGNGSENMEMEIASIREELQKLEEINMELEQLRELPNRLEGYETNPASVKYIEEKFNKYEERINELEMTIEEIKKKD
ncbi:MAG: hypothetical protein B7C24_16790 [Bacteroidetes bacterium 4572_77]|nr:MAG: hypothetical protein B7C24_16790 [Bacteroidetes bacterium 4572_77]